jgi:hypothetical protein
VPYTTVLVRLAEQDDLLIYGTWIGAQPPQVEGTPVVARFADHDDFTLVDWGPEA